jgi:hypothetical protein
MTVSMTDSRALSAIRFMRIALNTVGELLQAHILIAVPDFIHVFDFVASSRVLLFVATVLDFLEMSVEH